jgi:hypothetical protein
MRDLAPVLKWYKRLFILGIVLMIGGPALGGAVHSKPVIYGGLVLAFLCVAAGCVLVVIATRHDKRDMDQLLQQGLERQRQRRRTQDEPPR